jgi:SAM-dependent methyltransferase
MIPKTSQILFERRVVWKSKRILNRLYHRWYQIIQGAIKPGTTLEIGGGSGNFKEYFPDAISSDILFVKWLDAVLDAHHLPFGNETFENIILFDVLHHLQDPVSFFSDAERVLKHGGRIIMMEPYISLASFIVYRFFHFEGMSWYIDPFDPVGWSKEKKPFHGNQAIPTLIFKKYKHLFDDKFPCLKIIRKEPMDPVIYPLSGGFHYSSLCPQFLCGVLECIEELLRPMNRFLGFRLFVVLEKISNNPVLI